MKPSLQKSTSVLLVVLFLFFQFFGVLFPFRPVKAAIDNTITYQAKIRDSNGLPLNGDYSMKFSIYTLLTGGTARWSEIHDGNNLTTQVTINSGVFSVPLNDYCDDWEEPTHANCSYDLGGVEWGGDLYLEVEIDYDNNGSFEETFSPRKRITSVPTAMNANKLDGMDSTNFLSSKTSDTFEGSNDQTLTMESNLGSGDRAADLMKINQANDATYSSDSELLEVNQQDTDST
ncbi:MAG: hypothetical protein GF332_03930, partial [Candidatus Moranbacteria bacterium]|nr:hypothetical protein [Candidatus Moranbacteria bacterium]